jgi:hypothetical protein
MANDPDNTLIEDWRELHSFIWEELKLPFGDSLFIRSINQNLPNQVNLTDNPEIGKAHLHDIIHTWGDYMHGRKRGFDRQDAVEGAQSLRDSGIYPKVWIDHASFIGNMIHGTNKGALDQLKDSSGHVYENFVYSLDIARKLGIRYVWNGEVTSVVGQDREMKFDDHVRQSGGSSLKASIKSGLQRFGISSAYQAPDNMQYYKRKFEDGSYMYCFKRYGTWQDADIDGLHNLINPEKIEELINAEGTAIVYSHLGKRHSKESNRTNHIPDTTRSDLRNLKEKYEAKEVMVSSASRLLDYLVLRDNIEIDLNKYEVNFNADGVSFQELNSDSLARFSFSFLKEGFNLEKLKVLIVGTRVDSYQIESSDKVFTIHF